MCSSDLAFGLSLPVYALVFSANEEGGLGKTLLAFLVMGWIIWRHRANLARLRAGTENRFEKKARQKPKF